MKLGPYMRGDNPELRSVRMIPASDLKRETSYSIPFVSTAFIAPRNPFPAASATAMAVCPFATVR